MINESELTTRDRAQLLSTINGLPPLQYLLLCRTDDQESHWLCMQKNYKALASSFAAFFGGQSDEVLESLNSKEKEFLFLLRDWYLGFYTAIQGSWQEIKQAFDAKGYSLSDIPANSPGEALIRVIENDCAAFFATSQQKYMRWTPDETRKIAKLERELSEMESRGEITSPLYKTKQRAYQALVNKGTWLNSYISFRECCLTVCAKSKKGSATHRHLVAYGRIEAELDKRLQAELHSRKGRKGFEWANGTLRQMGSEGGVPIP